jgi:hypothetical protein
MSEFAPPPDEPRNPSVRSEPTDLNFRSVMTFFASLALGLVLIGAGAWGMVVYLTNRAAEQKRSDSLWVGEDRNASLRLRGGEEMRREELGYDRSRLPSLPRLEGVETEPFGQELVPAFPGFMQEQVQQENQRLAVFGWVDREKGIVHIPIEEAMKKLAGRLPARDGADVSEFLNSPSRSSSGRVPRGGD